MRKKFKKLFYYWTYLDFTDNFKKEDTYFYRFSQEIANNNLHMMRSMSLFLLIIGTFVLASSFTYFGEIVSRTTYGAMIIMEIFVLIAIHLLESKKPSPKLCTVFTTLHLFHILVLTGYIGVVFCKDEVAVIFVVMLTISSMIFTLPTTITMSIATFSTFLMLTACYYFKESYWFESDTLNSISVLIFSFLFGWKINRVRAEEAFARADALKLNTDLKKLSITDQLTGLYNHRSFQDTYYEMFCRGKAQNLPLGIIMMDLDKFKSYNDNYGHVAGDECLHRVANAIIASVPTEAMTCRYGGEEFIVLLDEKLCHEAETIGENIRKSVMALQIPHTYGSSNVSIVTISLGAYVGIPAENEQPMSFVDRADKAMYQSKKEGRNRLNMALI